MSISAPTALFAVPYGSAANVSTSGPIALAAGAPAGSKVVLHAGYGNASATLTPSDTQGNTWNLVATITQGTGSQTVTYTWEADIPVGKALVAGVDTITVASSLSSNSLAVYAQMFTGAQPGINTTPVTQSVGTGATTVTFPAFVVPTNGVLLVKVNTSALVTGLSTFSPAGVAQDYIFQTTVTNTRGEYGLIGVGLSGSITPGVHTNSGQVYSAVEYALTQATAQPGISFGGAVQM